MHARPEEQDALLGLYLTGEEVKSFGGVLINHGHGAPSISFPTTVPASQVIEGPGRV